MAANNFFKKHRALSLFIGILTIAIVSAVTFFSLSKNEVLESNQRSFSEAQTQAVQALERPLLRLEVPDSGLFVTSLDPTQQDDENPIRIESLHKYYVAETCELDGVSNAAMLKIGDKTLATMCICADSQDESGRGWYCIG